MHIGPYHLSNRLILAPMAGVTDRPFRRLCRRYGAALAVSEMVSANPALRDGPKSLARVDHTGEPEPHSVQLLGNDPAEMAEAARLNVARGAQIIDINMGCPAKKVCNKAAGSALLRDEALVGRILESVVAAVDVPVTLKIRTGWDLENRNAVAVAGIAEQAGIQAITVHGRSRACAFAGVAEYCTIREVKQAVTIPVIANGDIDSPAKAAAVLAETGADAVMIGRAALGRPWLFQAMAGHLAEGRVPDPPGLDEVRQVVLEHLRELHAFHGAHRGVRIARKHVAWYLAHLACPPDFLPIFNREDSAARQLSLVEGLFDSLLGGMAA